MTLVVGQRESVHYAHPTDCRPICDESRDGADEQYREAVQLRRN